LEALPSNIWVSRVWLFVVPQQEKKAVPTIQGLAYAAIFLPAIKQLVLAVCRSNWQSVSHPSIIK